jgi:hypothetical protein
MISEQNAMAFSLCEISMETFSLLEEILSAICFQRQRRCNDLACSGIAWTVVDVNQAMETF